MEMTDQQFIDCCREHRLMTARRIKGDAERLVRDDLTFDCGDNILARAMQARLKERR